MTVDEVLQEAHVLLETRVYPAGKPADVEAAWDNVTLVMLEAARAYWLGGEKRRAQC